MQLLELAELTEHINTAISAKRSEFMKINGASVSECFTEFSAENDGEVAIFFSLVFTYENARKEIFITENKRCVTTDRLTLTDLFKNLIVNELEHKIELFTDRISPYLD